MSDDFVFSFDFQQALESASLAQDTSTLCTNDTNRSSAASEYIPSLERLSETILVERVRLESENPSSTDGMCLLRRNLKDVEYELAERDDDQSALSQALELCSDVVRGTYEGGMKTWECAFDLVSFIANKSEGFRNVKVLEVGCGAALPGIQCLQCPGVDRVDFQDYNQEVIELVTVPNVIVNLVGESNLTKSEDDGSFFTCQPPYAQLPSLSKQVRFWYGDWTNLVDAILAKEGPTFRYDVIMGSEIMYDSSAYPKIHNVLKGLLSWTGVAYLASKCIYFGVGGNTRDFCAYLAAQETEKDGLRLHAEVCAVSASVNRLSREILEIRWVREGEGEVVGQ